MSDFLLNRHYREWLWIAGENGKPGINTDAVNAAEATRMITDHLVEVEGTNAASASISLNAEGGINVTTAATDDDQSILLPHEDANFNQLHPDNFTYRTDRELEFECALKMPASILTKLVMCGFKTDNSPADLAITDTGLLCFNFNTDDSDTTWGIVGDIAAGSGDVDIDTGVTVVASGVYHFKIAYDAAGYGHCYINGQHVHTFDMTAGVDLQVPFIGLQTLATGAASPITVYGWRVSRAIGQAR